MEGIIIDIDSSEISHISKVNELISLYKDKYSPAELELVKSIFLFRIRDHKINPASEGINENGEHFEYPPLNILSNEVLENLGKIEFQNLNNKTIRIHLLSILMLSGNKHNSFINILKNDLHDIILEHLDKHENENCFSTIESIDDYLNNLIFVSKMLSDFEILHEIISKLINKEEYSCLVTYATSIILDNFKYFKSLDKSKIEGSLKKQIETEENDYTKIDLCNLVIGLKTKLNEDRNSYVKTIANSYENIALSREDGGSLIHLDKAMAGYEQLKDQESINRIKEEYEKRRELQFLHDVKSEIEVTDYVKYSEHLIAETLKGTESDIIEYLINSDDLLVDKQSCVEMTNQLFSENMMLLFCAHFTYDINGHVAAHHSTEDEKFNYFVLSNYFHSTRLRFNLFTQPLLEQAIQSNKITPEALIQYLEDETWYGTEVSRNIRDGNELKYKWIDVLRPGIVLYFEIVSKPKETDVINKAILCIDSLGTKIEGILRELLRLISYRTFYSRHDKNKNVVVKEKDLNMLLSDKVVKDYLGDEVAIFLSSAFVKRSGWNIRNNLAHSFYTIGHYNRLKLDLIFVAIMKLASFKPNTSDNRVDG